MAGPTCCGKSQFEGAPENIIWCYGIYQPAYNEMQRNISDIKFVEGVPSDLESMIKPSIRNLVVIDDLMHELSMDMGDLPPCSTLLHLWVYVKRS